MEPVLKRILCLAENHYSPEESKLEKPALKGTF